MKLLTATISNNPSELRDKKQNKIVMLNRQNWKIITIINNQLRRKTITKLIINNKVIISHNKRVQTFSHKLTGRNALKSQKM